MFACSDSSVRRVQVAVNAADSAVNCEELVEILRQQSLQPGSMLLSGSVTAHVKDVVLRVSRE